MQNQRRFLSVLSACLLLAMLSGLAVVAHRTMKRSASDKRLRLLERDDEEAREAAQQGGKAKEGEKTVGLPGGPNQTSPPLAVRADGFGVTPPLRDKGSIAPSSPLRASPTP